jgi:non-ribosomal peptide synthetase component F
MRRGVLVAVAALWSLGIGIGGWEMYRYVTTSGETAAAPASWPAASRIPVADSGATVVMFVHPECPCSRASLAELAEIARITPVTPRVVFVGGDGAAAATSAFEHVLRIVDATDAEAVRFGALTSGDVVVYGADGALRFSGGITGSRGHVGDNIGRRAALAAITGADNSPTTHAVFGCGLLATTTETATAEGAL